MLHASCIVRVSFLMDVLSHEWHTNIVSSSSLGFKFKCALRVPFLVHTFSYQSISSVFSFYQSVLYGSCVSFLEHLYSTSSPWNFWSFSFFWLIIITSKRMYFHFFFFLVSLYSHVVHSCRSSVSISTLIWSYNKVPTGIKGSKILIGISGVGLWQNKPAAQAAGFPMRQNPPLH